MRIVCEKNWVFLLMIDGSYFELELPSEMQAIKLKDAIQIGIADTIEELNYEGSQGTGPIRRS